uniref:Phosphate import ATP-binding protein PstB (Phosphate-transporting ATPase)) n=1 Tax=Ganoderma boninense TaxID=34458 RepID=A0A5K1K2R4_9APHY|nr:Phosphate import ATP-binding protein PstB (EC (ABC phosphate transporter) (Phosphate-transporting ATPase) [Ganoderma boninense]
MATQSPTIIAETQAAPTCAMPLSEGEGGGPTSTGLGNSKLGKGKGSKKPWHKETIVVAGLPVNVFSDPGSGGRAEVDANASAGVVVMFLLHGRTGSARRMETYVTDIFAEIRARRGADAGAQLQAQELLIVTIDQRNHGKRMVDERANMGWSTDPDKNNERHAIDMYAIQSERCLASISRPGRWLQLTCPWFIAVAAGTAQDVSFLIDFLPSYLFPRGERTISQWVCAGKSLGGHSTWIVLRNGLMDETDPRVNIGIPIIGCPDYLTLISKRAKAHKLPFGPPHIPDTLVQVVKRADPVTAPYTAADESNPFLGKKILVLSGREDKTVPWSAAKDFVEGLNVGEQGVKEVMVEPGTGHDFSPAMVKEAARFVWEHALVA